ncbi:MAG: DinB family protein [Chloroflexota bacterium]
MDKSTLMEKLKAGRAEWEALLARIVDKKLVQPGVVGEMSVKDIIAHVTWYEREIVDVLQKRALVGSELWDLPQDQRNAAIFEAYRERSLSQVTEEGRQVFEQLVAALQSFPGDDLSDPVQFRDMPADWIPWDIIAQNSYEHYQQHIPDILSWLETTS